MHIVVCAKWIPDPEVSAVQFRIDPETQKREKIDGLAYVVSPYDEQCFEAALRIRDELGEEEVQITALCLGPESDIKLFKRAFSWDVQTGYFLCDPAFDGGDGYTTSLALGTAIRKIGDVDLVLTGQQAADGDEGVVGFGIAEFLGVPLLPCAGTVKVSDGSVVVDRILDDGFETLETQLPAVVTISNELGEPRRPSMRQVMKAGRMKPEQWTAADIGLDVAQLGGAGVRLVVDDVFVPEIDHTCEFLTGGSPDELAESLVSRLHELRVLS